MGIRRSRDRWGSSSGIHEQTGFLGSGNGPSGLTSLPEGRRNPPEAPPRQATAFRPLADSIVAPGEVVHGRDREGARPAQGARTVPSSLSAEGLDEAWRVAGAVARIFQ